MHRVATLGLLSLSGFAALVGWPDWLPDLPQWGQEWELADLEQSLDLHPPVEVERWLYNPRERTALGLERLGEGAPDGENGEDGEDGEDAGDVDESADRALAAFEAAARLAPNDRRVLFNTGTARLLADHGDAVEALERAVADGDVPSLPPGALQSAWYNLGAARMAADDAAGAVDAFEEALRRDPADADAKYNLEVALRRLAEERRKLLPPRETPGGDRPGEEADSDDGGGTEPDDRRGDDESGAREPEDGDREADARPDGGSAYGHRPVEGFEEQSDLTAAQAATLLEAVENLERRERRIEAARSAADAAATEEDW